MALTPEDVVNKRFQTTLTDGYDQDEVDDFLDDVVVELRRVIRENAELRERTSQAEAAASPTSAYTAPQSDTPDLDPSNTNNLLQLARRLHEEHVREGMEKRDALIAEGESEAARLKADALAVQEAAVAQAEAASRLQADAQARLSEAEAAVATRLQDAEAAAARLVSGLEAAAAARIADQETAAARSRDEAESVMKERLAALEAEAVARIAGLEARSREAIETLRSEKLNLEAAVEGLRGFEREYRKQLRDFIATQLDQLDAAASAPSGPVSGPGNPVPLVEPEAQPAPSEPAEVAARVDHLDYGGTDPAATAPGGGVPDDVEIEPISWDPPGGSEPVAADPPDDAPRPFPPVPAEGEPPTVPRPPFSGFGDR